MNLKTITYDSDTWQLVPKESDEVMSSTGESVAIIHDEYGEDLRVDNIEVVYRAMVATAPQPEALSPWLPIESAPKDGTRIIISDGKDWVRGWYSVELNKFTSMYSVYARYWMPAPPLPQAPTESLDAIGATAPEVE